MGKLGDREYYLFWPDNVKIGEPFEVTAHIDTWFTSLIAYCEIFDINKDYIANIRIGKITKSKNSPAVTKDFNFTIDNPKAAFFKMYMETIGNGTERTASSDMLPITGAKSAPTIPSSITIPGTIYAGTSFTVSWGASIDSDGDLSGYELERSINGGAWTQIYKGSATSTANTIGTGVSKVAYRVRAYDSTGLYSNYKTSDTRTVLTNTAPTTPPNINVPATINGGTTIPISWGESTDSNGNLSGYQLERLIDGGANWTLVYQGRLLTTNDTVPFGTKTVTYRVRAFDALGAYSGYNTSATRTVINNSAPSAPASITVPNTVDGGKNVTVTWGAATDADDDLAGYQLELSVDGGDFAEIYNGKELSYAGNITKGWQTVAYRVRAYDSYKAYGPYTTSDTRTVNNNSAPLITCAFANNTQLGTKGSGFTISYSVSDEDGDEITVTESVDGVTKRQFTAIAGQNYSFALSGEYFMQVLNGSHTLTITADDGTEVATHKLYFSKLVGKATITLKAPIVAAEQITVMVMTVTGHIPADANYKVEVTNNANDRKPVWEDCTSAVKNGTNYVFTNEASANGPAFNFRITAERANGGEGGYITSVQGAFQYTTSTGEASTNALADAILSITGGGDL